MWAEGVLSLCADWLTAACQLKLGDISEKDLVLKDGVMLQQSLPQP